MTEHDPLSEALHGAVARAATDHADYRVPEGAVRAKARRRRTLRAAGVSTLSLALLAGAGLAAANLGDGRADVGPHAPTTSLTVIEPPTTIEPTPDPVTALDVCGSVPRRGSATSSDWLYQEIWTDDALPLGATTLQVEVALLNPNAFIVSDAVQGGPVLLVLDAEGRVVAVSRTTEPLPEDDLNPDDSFTFSRFEELVDCSDGSPLAPGRYTYLAARIVSDPAPGEPALDLWTDEYSIFIDAEGVERHVATWPDMPACHEPVPKITLAPDAVRTTIEDFDVIEVEGPGETGGGGAGPDNTVITLTMELDTPAAPISAEQGSHYVVVQDGVVVGTMARSEGWGSAVHFRGTAFTEDLLTLRFDDCDGPGEFVPLVLDGSYTLYGYTLYLVDNPLGVRDDLLVALGPYDFEHEPPPGTWTGD